MATISVRSLVVMALALSLLILLQVNLGVHLPSLSGLRIQPVHGATIHNELIQEPEVHSYDRRNLESANGPEKCSIGHPCVDGRYVFREC